MHTHVLVSIHILHGNCPKQEILFYEKKFGIYCLLQQISFTVVPSKLDFFLKHGSLPYAWKFGRGSLDQLLISRDRVVDARRNLHKIFLMKNIRSQETPVSISVALKKKIF